ncbi:MAG: DedA family protein [Pelagibacteraceae bacterium]|nr:DedA family protein [Pelagibacteraceae bacterium]
MFKDLLNKTIALAAHKSARFFLSFICIIESIFFPIPPDVMIIPMTLAQKKRWVQIATIATVSSVIGGIIGYAIGFFFYKEVGIHIFEFYGFEGFKSFKEQIAIGKGFWAWIILLGIAGFTPVPFKLLTISSGLIHFNFLIFILVATITRGSRFFILAGLLSFFGHKILPYIKKFSGKILIVITFLLLLGFYIAYLIYNNYEKFMI